MKRAAFLLSLLALVAAPTFAARDFVSASSDHVSGGATVDPADATDDFAVFYRIASADTFVSQECPVTFTDSGSAEVSPYIDNGGGSPYVPAVFATPWFGDLDHDSATSISAGVEYTGGASYDTAVHVWYDGDELDGGSSSYTGSAMDATSIGRRAIATPVQYFDGVIDYVLIWEDRNPADAIWLDLHNGRDPRTLGDDCPDHGYYLTGKYTGTEVDVFGDVDLTITGTTVVDSTPRGWGS